MKWTNKKLDRVYSFAKRITLCDGAKVVIMSDAHRGDGSRSDNFSNNQEIYFSALSQYVHDGYVYFELGDGDELWENASPKQSILMHKDVFWLLKNLYKERRLIMLHGNHDSVKRSAVYMRKNYSSFIDSRTKQQVSLFGDMPVYEAVVLKLGKKEILLLHGHQVDFFNSSLVWLARFLVRYFWRPLETFGVNDLTSAAKNYHKKEATERKLISWLKKEKVMMIAGHTHRPVFAQPGQPRYFNDGSGVHPRCITAIEINDGNISLVKWAIKTRDDGTMYVGKDILEGPQDIGAYF